MSPISFLLPVAVLAVALLSAAVTTMLRDAASKRRLVPWLLALSAIALPALWVMLPPPESGARVAAAIAVLAAAAMLGVLALARFCDACSQAILPRGLVHVRECPRCGDDLRAQHSARVAGISREPMRRARTSRAA